MCRCDSTENKLLIQIFKYKYNNDQNSDKAAWNKNELTICGVTNTALAKTNETTD